MEFTFRWVPTPGQNNTFVTNNNSQIRAFVDETQQDPFDSPLYMCVPPITFAGGNADVLSLYDFAKTIATCGLVTTVQNPAINYNGNRLSTGGSLTLNGNPCGNYEYNVLPGGTILTQADVASLFSDRHDVASFIVAKGDLTIDSNTFLIPTVNPNYTPPNKTVYNFPPDPDVKRRLFMVIYVTGNLVFTDGSSYISMTACGANTSPTGANIASFDIPISSDPLYFTNTGQPVTPYIAAVGALGGSASDEIYGYTGNNGGSDFTGTVLKTGGGGSGNKLGTVLTRVSGAGGNGSSFSGGTGGGSATDNFRTLATAGSSLGGAGGNGSAVQTDAACGGTGNPGGTAGGGGTGLTGTGGIVIVICEGTITSNGGEIIAFGVSGENYLNTLTSNYSCGGCSGGGIIVTVQSSSTAFFPQMYADGGTSSVNGGPGGYGCSFGYGING